MGGIKVPRWCVAEPPESSIHAKNSNAADPWPLALLAPRGCDHSPWCRAFLVSGSLEQNYGTRMPCVQAVGQFLAHKSTADQGVIDPAELPKRQVFQAAAKRIADQQRAGQHGSPDHHAEANSQIAAPVVGQIAQ